MRDKRERMHGEVSGECDGSILSLIPHSLSLERIRQKAILFPLWPLRLARSRTQDFHSCNTGSNPVGVTRRSGECPPPTAFLAEHRSDTIGGNPRIIRWSLDFTSSGPRTGGGCRTIRAAVPRTRFASNASRNLRRF